jgi:hypothetical protein
MYCKHCGKEIADNSTFCQYCGGKQDIAIPTDYVQETKIGSFKAEETVVEEASETPEFPITIDAFTATEPTKWKVFDENAEYTLDQLNSYIKEGVALLQKMANDFPNIKRFSHYSQFAAVLTPSGLLGSLREGIQNKKLARYLGTKIYNGMAYNELGDYVQQAAEDLSKAQIKVQKMVSPSDAIYYGNAKSIMDVCLKYLAEWKEIAPEVYKEEVTLNTGDKVNLGDQIEFWTQKELVNMELPEGEYKEVKSNVKAVVCGSGCMVFIGIVLASSFLAACTLL